MISSARASLDVLRLVADHPGEGLSELARLAEMNKSRVYRLLCTLVEAGFVHQDSEGRYRLGFQAVVLGHAARTQFDLARLAETAVERFAVTHDENVQLRVRDGREMVQVYARRSRQVLRVESVIGNRRRLGQGASGRLLLAHAGADLIAELAPEQKDALARIRAAGIAHSRGELTEGVGAIAVAIPTADGQVTSCLSVSVPLARLTDDYAQTLTGDLTATVQQIAAALGVSDQGDNT